MLDGSRYFAEFPDENPAGMGQVPLRPELLTALMAIEREISGFMRNNAASGDERCKSAGG
jgi:hypothetical protein